MYMYMYLGSTFTQYMYVCISDFIHIQLTSMSQRVQLYVSMYVCILFSFSLFAIFRRLCSMYVCILVSSNYKDKFLKFSFRIFARCQRAYSVTIDTPTCAVAQSSDFYVIPIFRINHSKYPSSISLVPQQQAIHSTQSIYNISITFFIRFRICSFFSFLVFLFCSTSFANKCLYIVQSCIVYVYILQSNIHMYACILYSIWYVYISICNFLLYINFRFQILVGL